MFNIRVMTLNKLQHVDLTDYNHGLHKGLPKTIVLIISYFLNTYTCGIFLEKYYSKMKPNVKTG